MIRSSFENAARVHIMFLTFATMAGQLFAIVYRKCLHMTAVIYLFALVSDRLLTPILICFVGFDDSHF